MNEVYSGFDNWKDVQEQYEHTEKEPDEVFYAEYDGGGYEGWSFIVFRNGEDYFLEESAHCSCYGLEHSWDPEKYDKETLIAVLEKRQIENKSFKEKFEQILNKIKGA